MIVLADRYTLPPALERATGFVAPAAFAALAAAGIATACVGVGATQAAAPRRPGRGGHRGAPYRLRLCRDPRRNAGAVDRDRPAAQLIHALERTGANPPMYRTNRSRHDVVIVGGRVAGSAAALLLARLGHDVVVVDRALFPSDTLSTHSIARSGVVQLNRWGLLDAVLDSGVPAIRAGPRSTPVASRSPASSSTSPASTYWSHRAATSWTRSSPPRPTWPAPPCAPA